MHTQARTRSPSDTAPRGLAELLAARSDVVRIVELGMQTPEHVAVATIADGVATDLSGAATAAAAAVPTMLMARQDWAEDAQRWATANMPQAYFATMDLHMGFVTDPDGFNATIREFVGTS